MSKRQLLLSIIIILTPVFFGILLVAKNQNQETNALFSSLKKIGVVEIIDVILSSEETVHQLQQYRKDNSIAAVLLRIESPGGAVAPSQEIYEEVMRYRIAKKPIIVSMGSVAASGGYYIASAATKIFANSGTITGSIGVIFQFPQYHKFLEKIGVKITTIKAGEYKDVGNPNRELTEKERNYLQQFIMGEYEQFILDVSTARNLPIDSIRKLAEGRIYSGKYAVATGLIDTLGSYVNALEYIKTHCNLPEKTKIVQKNKYPRFLDEVFSERLKHLFTILKISLMPASSYYLFTL
ncbi:MAG: signal peptide peptidase SppA [Chitinivibrionales bacterium]|nr:signal peptide peptidase SppA [Chitinivibrionales bacterium]